MKLLEFIEVNISAALVKACVVPALKDLSVEIQRSMFLFSSPSLQSCLSRVISAISDRCTSTASCSVVPHHNMFEHCFLLILHRKTALMKESLCFTPESRTTWITERSTPGMAWGKLSCWARIFGLNDMKLLCQHVPKTSRPSWYPCLLCFKTHRGEDLCSLVFRLKRIAKFECLETQMWVKV